MMQDGRDDLAMDLVRGSTYLALAASALWAVIAVASDLLSDLESAQLVALLLAPVAVAACPLVLRRHGRTLAVALAALILCGYAIVGGASLGLWYWPAAAMMAFAAMRRGRGSRPRRIEPGR
jgi:hypothetical protein